MKTNIIESESIKTQLKQKNILLSDIATACNVSSSTLTAVLNRKGQSLPVATAICLALNKPVIQVFGDVEPYYNPKKRGPKDRSKRTAQVVEAIRSGQPVPDDCQQVCAQSA